MRIAIRITCEFQTISKPLQKINTNKTKQTVNNNALKNVKKYPTKIDSNIKGTPSCKMIGRKLKRSFWASTTVDSVEVNMFEKKPFKYFNQSYSATDFKGKGCCVGQKTDMLDNNRANTRNGNRITLAPKNEGTSYIGVYKISLRHGYVKRAEIP